MISAMKNKQATEAMLGDFSKSLNLKEQKKLIIWVKPNLKGNVWDSYKSLDKDIHMADTKTPLTIEHRQPTIAPQTYIYIPHNKLSSFLFQPSSFRNDRRY